MLTNLIYVFCDISGGVLIKCWKSIHSGQIAGLDINKSGTILASGGSDSVIRIWDVLHNACTLALKEAKGVIRFVL